MIFRESELKRMVTTTAQYKKTESHFNSSGIIVRVLFDLAHEGATRRDIRYRKGEANCTAE